MIISTINFLTCLRIAPFLIISIAPIFGDYSSFEDNRIKCQEKERLALLKFKAGLIDDYGRLSAWGNEGDIGEKDCCKWEGILCDNRTNHVVALNLQGELSPSGPLRGKISPSLLELADLIYLDLSFNDFNKSQIPEFVGSLGKLQSLSLGYSNLGGLIPHSLGNLSMLRHLDLNNNWLHDTNLDWLSGLQSLEYLDLSDNNLKGRNIPNVLGNLTSLSHLDLTNNSLQGRIPDVLGNLMSLSYLSLWNNKLEGSIPDALWNLTELSFLDLSKNQLQGEFLQPSSSNQLNLRLPNLETLDLSKNMFSGRIPNLSSCSSLKRLALRCNMFNGTLPKSIGYLSNVHLVDLSQNHLEGLVSEAHLLFNLSKLRYLDLSFNSNLTVRINSSWNPPFQLGGLLLSGCNLGPYFPKWLRKQKQLEVLRISSAKISDTVPDWFWDNNIQTCTELNMSDNQMYGVIPDLSLKLNLWFINLSSNEFNGSLPQLPPVVGTVDLSKNRFSGTIINFCNLTSLHSLDLSDNLLSMEIPQYCFTNLMMSLSYLNLRNNNFFGEVPNSADLMICRVYSLHLRNNSFTGEISRSLKNCHNLNILDLGENKFIGKIPSWLGESMPKLSVLSLTSNNLHGSLPSSLCHLQKLQVLDISMNKISGTIPKCLKNLTMLRSKIDFKTIDYWTFHIRSDIAGDYDRAYIMWKGKEAEYVSNLQFLRAIDLSSNNLTGEIPHEVASLVSLIALNLSRNNLVGSIPGDIDRLELLNFLDFSRNNLSGGIPPSLSQLSHLGVLDLSFNNLSGRIPWNTHLQTFNASVYMGNPGLCGPPLEFKPCPEDEMPRSNVDETDKLDDEYNIFKSRGFYISMVLGFIVAFWGVSGTLFLNKWCATTILKMFINVEDWLYVKILVTKNRLRRYYENC